MPIAGRFDDPAECPENLLLFFHRLPYGFRMKDGRVVTETNNCGGILGGISDGMPIIFRAAIKPTPSISQKQRTVNLQTGENAELEIHGRHDPCIVPRAVPVIEAATAVALINLF